MSGLQEISDSGTEESSDSSIDSVIVPIGEKDAAYFESYVESFQKETFDQDNYKLGLLDDDYEAKSFDVISESFLEAKLTFDNNFRKTYEKKMMK